MTKAEMICGEDLYHATVILAGFRREAEAANCREAIVEERGAAMPAAAVAHAMGGGK